MVIEVEINKSGKKDKKLVAKFQFPDGKRKTTHFGAKGYSDFTIHKNPNRKEKYLRRHNREDWEDFTSAGALSRWILWNEPDLETSFSNYLARFSLDGELNVKSSQAGHIPPHRE